MADELTEKPKRRKTTIADVESAYRSLQYSLQREDVEALMQNAINRSNIRQDLVCPFEIDPQTTTRLAAAVQENRRESLTPAGKDRGLEALSDGQQSLFYFALAGAVFDLKRDVVAQNCVPLGGHKRLQ